MIRNDVPSDSSRDAHFSLGVARLAHLPGVQARAAARRGISVRADRYHPRPNFRPGHLDGFALSFLASQDRAACAGRSRCAVVRGRHHRRSGRMAKLQFFKRVLCADLSNFFLLQYRGVDGFLITGKNSGTH